MTFKGKLFIGETEHQPGDVVKDFRGDSVIIKGWYLPGEVARNARVELCTDLEYPEQSGLYCTGIITARIVHDGEEYSS
jgi:hypothetical protein